MRMKQPAVDQERIKAILADKQTFTVPRPSPVLKEQAGPAGSARIKSQSKLQISKAASQNSNPFNVVQDDRMHTSVSA